MLAESVHRALLKDRFLFRVVTLVVSYDDFSTFTRSKTVSFGLQSEDPTYKMSKTSKIFKAKINGIKNRKELIDLSEAEKRRVMTIHGSKGLEALAVFLHTAITPKIQKAIVIPSKESQAEARVWYVGITRAIKHLYLVTDEGHNYKLPVIPPAPVEIDLIGVDVWADDVYELEHPDW